MLTKMGMPDMKDLDGDGAIGDTASYLDSDLITWLRQKSRTAFWQGSGCSNHIRCVATGRMMRRLCGSSRASSSSIRARSGRIFPRRAAASARQC
jgi:hypothetical protein